DAYLIAVNKPVGLLVHRTKIAEEEEEFLLQKLRDQTGKFLYPVHRLDRPTSGVVVFAFNADTAAKLAKLFVSHDIKKEYIALVRGWFPDEVNLDYPVKNEKGNSREASTHFELIGRFELPIPTDRYPTTRFSIVKCLPKTGRWHQLRQHLAHLRHYIINDRVHGDGKCNRIFTEKVGVREMFLHARLLAFAHPDTNQSLEILAEKPVHWSFLNELARS
ncbi:MAG: pseudouridine synthase, partial [Bacteroidales bacterium]